MAAPATLQTWTGDPALAWVICAAVLYAIGGKHLPRAGSIAEQRWRTASFVAGLATIVIALDSPIDELADKLLWVHMVQHILLLLVAPPLLALARPWNRMWHGFPLEWRRWIARRATHGRVGVGLGAVAAVLGASMLLFLFNVVYSLIFKRERSEPNPWRSKSLEWQLPTPIPVHDFDEIPTIDHDPYDYGVPPAGTKPAEEPAAAS